MDTGGLGFETTAFTTGSICPKCGKRGKTFIIKSEETLKLITVIICFDCKVMSEPRKALGAMPANCKDLKESVNSVLKVKISEVLPKVEDTKQLLKIIDLLNETTDQ